VCPGTRVISTVDGWQARLVPSTHPSSEAWIALDATCGCVTSVGLDFSASTASAGWKCWSTLSLWTLSCALHADSPVLAPASLILYSLRRISDPTESDPIGSDDTARAAATALLSRFRSGLGKGGRR
jgi:hypothetical protein